MYFINRDDVLAILDHYRVVPEVMRVVRAIPAFPVPNPDRLGRRNVMGQTETEFYEAIER